MRVFIRTRTRIRMRTDVNASCIQSRLWTHTPTRARAYTQMRILMDVLPEADLSSARKRMLMIHFARCWYVHTRIRIRMHALSRTCSENLDWQYYASSFAIQIPSPPLPIQISMFLQRGGRPFPSHSLITKLTVWAPFRPRAYNYPQGAPLAAIVRQRSATVCHKHPTRFSLVFPFVFQFAFIMLFDAPVLLAPENHSPQQSATSLPSGCHAIFLSFNNTWWTTILLVRESHSLPQSAISLPSVCHTVCHTVCRCTFHWKNNEKLQSVPFDLIT